MATVRQPYRSLSGPAYGYIRDSDRLPTYAQIASVRDPLCRVKLFGGPGTWWIAAYDPDTGVAFGVAETFGREAGDFSMWDLLELRIPPFGLPIERDLHWTPRPLSAVLAEGA